MYGIIGFICAASFHGLWNYNLSQYSRSTMPIMVLMVILGLVICKFAATDLNNKYRQSLRKRPDFKQLESKREWLEGDGPQTD